MTFHRYSLLQGPLHKFSGQKNVVSTPAGWEHVSLFSYASYCFWACHSNHTAFKCYVRSPNKCFRYIISQLNVLSSKPYVTTANIYLVLYARLHNEPFTYAISFHKQLWDLVLSLYPVLHITKISRLRETKWRTQGHPTRKWPSLGSSPVGVCLQSKLFCVYEIFQTY